MTSHPLISNATDSHLLSGEGREAHRRRLGVRSLTKGQIEMTMFACGTEKSEGLKAGKATYG